MTASSTSRRTWRPFLLTVGGTIGFLVVFFGVILLTSRPTALDPSRLPAVPRDAAGAPPVPDGVWVGVVSRVVDGDTMWLAVQAPGETALEEGDVLRVHLTGVDAPSLDAIPPACLARPSHNFLRDFARVNTPLFVTPPARDGAVDAWLGNGLWVNGEVVRVGYGVIDHEAPAGRHQDTLEALEAVARADGRGVWNRDLCPSR